MTKQEFLAFSLPYKLKLQFKDREDKYCRKQVIGTLGGIYSDRTIICHDTVNAYPAKFKPILHPLSDLTKEIEHKGEKFMPMKEIAIYNPNNVEYLIECVVTGLVEYIVLRQLIEWHFDIANLIEKGEAIDVNTLPENPYK